jgi:nitrous oxidase accessory protein NosD
VLVSVMYGSDVEISGSEVRDSAWHAGIYVWDATGVRIVGNRIHDNGDRTEPSQANLDHGIYWAGGSGVVANNVIDHNVAYGVHLYPEANGVTVTQNTIVHSGRGGVIVADQAANTLVTNNVIADNDLYGIRGYDLTGTGNVARRNLLWHNGSENLSGAGIALSDNIVADPRLGTDLRPLASSPAIDAASPGAVMPVDLDGVARPRGAGPDIGAYEAG